MDDDPWRNPFAESLKDQHQPVEDSSSRVFEWRSPIVDAAELDIASPTFEPSAWDIERSNTVEWTPVVQDSTYGWEPTPLEGPGWTSYTVDVDEDVGVGVQEKRNQDMPESPTVGPAAWMESLTDSRDPEPHVDTDGHSSTQSVPTPSSPSSPAFGTFESATSAHEGEPANAWTPSVMLEPTDSADPWGSTWAESAPHIENETPDPPKDEWEAAAAVKQQRDNVVAPEELNGWVKQLQVAVEGLWPSQKDEQLDPNWRISLQDVPGVSFLSETFLPELELSRLPSYARTAVSKSSVTALKLTRHLPLARSSPLSILRIQKEATSWEQSVKRDPKRESVDWGWMVPPTDTSATGDQEAQTEVKKSGRIFSFLGRKSAAVAPPSATIAAAIQPGNSLRTSTPAPTGPTRISIDASSPFVPENASVHPASPVPSSMSAPPIPPLASASASVGSEPPPKLVAPEAPTSTSDAPSTSTPSTPSAVTRFLNRFSKMRSGDSAHKPLSLSISDVSFLEEVVPTRHAHDDDGFSALGFDDAPNGPPLSGKPPSSDGPLPAPLPPPPRSGITAPNTTASQLPLPSPPSKVEDDVWDVFAAPPSTHLFPSALPSHLLTRPSAIPPTRVMGPSSSTPSTVPRRSITPKMVPSTLSTGTVPSLLPPPARSVSALGVQKTLIPDIPQTQPSPSSPLSAISPFGPPYLDETAARSHHYAMKPHMYDTPPHSSGPDEAFDLFGDFTNSTPKPSTPTLPPTPPNKSPNRTYSGGSPTRGSLPRPGTTSQGGATRPASVPSSMLSASRKGSGLNFDFLMSDTTKPNVRVPAVPHGNGMAPPVAVPRRSSQSPPLRPSSQTVTAPSSLAPSRGRLASPHPSAPSINLTPSFGTMPVAASPTPPTVGSQGGLTAQDLSFFENL